MSTRNLDKLFDPKSIAVIGASNTKGSVGHILLRNLIGAEYEGVVYPVNPTLLSVQGIQAYPTICQVPRKIDLAIIAVPAKTVPDVVRECGEAGVAGAVIVSSGFKEVGAQGKKLEEQVLSIAESYGVRLVGPNCLGYIRPGANINATFAHVMPAGGRVAFISQSGALGTAILDWAAANQVGFSAFVSVGSMCDVDFGDLIDYFGADPHTSSIILYMEALHRRAQVHERRAPLRQDQADHRREDRAAPRARAVAAASHTGAIAGDDTLYSAAFRRAGVVRVDEIEDLFDASEALSRVSSPRGPRLGIVTNAGGPGVMACRPPVGAGRRVRRALARDRRQAAGVPAVVRRARQPRRCRRRRRRQALRRRRPGDDGRPRLRRRSRDPHAAGDELPDRDRAGSRRRGARTYRKPLLTSFMGEIKVADGLRVLREAHVPAFDTPEDAVRAYMYMYQYTRACRPSTRRRPTSFPTSIPTAPRSRTSSSRSRARDAPRSARSRRSRCSKPTTSRSCTTVTATSAEEAATAAEQIGFPVAIKILSHDITHKTDVGGVALNVRSGAETAKQFTKITERVKASQPDAKLIGVTVQAMSRGGYEVIIGSQAATAPSARRSCSAWAAPAWSSIATSPSTSRRSTRRSLAR